MHIKSPNKQGSFLVPFILFTFSIHTQFEEKNPCASWKDSSFYDMAAEHKTVFDNVPKSKEREANEESKRSAKVRDQGEEGVDEELLQHSRLDGPVSDHQPKLVEVLHGFCSNPILKVGARVEASSYPLNIGSVAHRKLDVKIVMLLKLSQL